MSLSAIKKGSMTLYQTYASYMVPPVGLEPTQYRYYWILSPTRLPISPRRRGLIINQKEI